MGKFNQPLRGNGSGGIVAHGGKRPNAGRKLGSKNRHKKQDLDNISREVLRSIDSVGLWRKLLSSNSPKTVCSGLMYLMDRVYGRPAQIVQGGTQPITIEFSWPGQTEWLNPAPVERVIPQIEARLSHVIHELDDKGEGS